MNDYAKLERESELCMFGFDSQIAAGQREMRFSGNNPIGQAYCDFFFFFFVVKDIYKFCANAGYLASWLTGVFGKL